MSTVFRNPNLAEVKHLLKECGLPLSDITPEHMQHFLAFGDDSDLWGMVGLEVYGSDALLRSLAVSPKHRNTSLGKKLVAHAEQYAGNRVCNPSIC